MSDQWMFGAALVVLVTAPLFRCDLLLRFVGRMARYALLFMYHAFGLVARLFLCYKRYELMADCARLALRIFNEVSVDLAKDDTITEIRISYNVRYRFRIDVPLGVPADMDVNSSLKELPQRWKPGER